MNFWLPNIFAALHIWIFNLLYSNVQFSCDATLTTWHKYLSFIFLCDFHREWITESMRAIFVYCFRRCPSSRKLLSLGCMFVVLHSVVGVVVVVVQFSQCNWGGKLPFEIFFSLRKPHASSAPSSLCLLHYSMAMMLSFSRSMSCSLLLIYELRRILMGSNFIFYQRDNENNERKINTVIFQSTLGTMSTMTFAPATNIWEFMDLLTNKRNV